MIILLLHKNQMQKNSYASLNSDPFIPPAQQTLPFLHDKRVHIIQEASFNINNVPRLSSKINTVDQNPQETQKGPSSVFSVPKGTIFIDRRMVPSPGKPFRQNAAKNIETQILKKKISELRSLQQESHGDFNLFNDVLKQFGLGQQGEPRGDSPVTKQPQYISYKKRAQQRKLKPILSEFQCKDKSHDFFNVQKVTLLSIQNKKSKSLLQTNFRQQDHLSPVQNVTRHKIFDDVEVKSEKLVIPGKTVMIVGEKQENNKCASLIIKAMEPRALSSQRDEFILRKLSLPGKFQDESKQVLVSLTQKSNQRQQNQDKLFQSLEKEHKQTERKQTIKQITRSKRKFQVPYPTYHYRHLLWKVNFTNRMFVEPPLEYEHRLKAFVGKGNNSCMVAGLISRRPWFAITQKSEEANFVWTQLKQLSFLKRQEPSAPNDCGDEQRGSYMPSSIFRDIDDIIFKSYFRTYFNSQEHADERMLPRCKYFKYRKNVKASQIKQQKLHNHLINNYVLGNKKALFNTMSNYYREIGEDVFSYLPLTFHIKQGLEDQRYFQFLKYYHKRAKQITKTNQQKGAIKQYNAWIVKPGQNSNRGNGIKMCLTLDEIKSVLKKRDKYNDGSYRTYIIQAYIERPLLYFKRKFDLRHYIMITCVNGLIKGYWYREGYVRTTSSQYSLKDSSGTIHLTNDAVQKNLPDYGKYEKGNKVSYQDLSTYIEKYNKKPNKSFFQHIYPKMRKIAGDAIRAASGGIDPAKLNNNFEIFGMDFMIDSNLDVWLIEINTNPCLELSCPLLGCIIPRMVEDALELTMDAMFPPPQRYSPKGMHYYKELQKQNKFELIYDERIEPLYQGSLQVLDNKLLQEQDDTFEDCGQEWEDG